MLKKLFIITLVCTICFARDFYVSPQGSDGIAGSGTKDRPVASIARAIERAQTFINVRGYPEQGITIYVADGVYQIQESIKIGSAFSGTENVPITIKPQEGAKPRMVGGYEFKLSDFTEVSDPAVIERLHPDAEGKVLMLDLRRRGITEYGELPLYGHSMGFLHRKTEFRSGDSAPELFFEAQPMTIARWPNEGYAEVGSVVEIGDIIRAWMPDAKGGKVMEQEYIPEEDRNYPPKGFAFEFDDKERLTRWQNAEDLRLYGYWFYNWSDQALQVADIDVELGVISTVQPGGYGVRKGQRFYAYNLLEELDKPGEWYLDRDKGVLYLIPPENNPDAKLHLSMLNEPFVFMNGASNLRIEGIEFGYSRANGLSIQNSNNITIADCTIANIAGVGIRVDNGYGNRVTGCEVFNTGSGGVHVTGGVVRDLKPSEHTVDNNLIYNYARIERTYNPAISLSGVGITVVHNEVHTGDHMAVRFAGNNHIIEYNHIYDVCRETDDMAAIYAGRSWTCRGTKVRYNLIRDVTGYASGTHRVSGIYLDDGISQTTVYGNIFLNCAQGLMFNGGRDQIAVDNVFIDIENMMRHTNMRQAFVTWAAMSWRTLNEGIKAQPINEEPWKSAYPNLATMLDDDPDLPKYNTIKNNLKYNAPLILGHEGIQDAVVEYGEVDNNIEISRRPGSFNEETGRFEFDPDSGVFELMPNLRNIQTEKIGRINK